jgi:hypothetical protein
MATYPTLSDASLTYSTSTSASTISPTNPFTAFSAGRPRTGTTGHTVRYMGSGSCGLPFVARWDFWGNATHASPDSTSVTEPTSDGTPEIDASAEAPVPGTNSDAALQLAGRIEALDARLDALHRCASQKKQPWYRSSGAVVSLLALIVSAIALIVGQINVASDRDTQDRVRLASTIQQIPTMTAQLKPGQDAQSFSLVAGSAAALMKRLGPDATTPQEKIEVATALIAANNLSSASEVAAEVLAQPTAGSVERAQAYAALARVAFESLDFNEAHKDLSQAVGVIQDQGNDMTPVVRRLFTVNYELIWASSEINYERNCQEASKQATAAERDSVSLPPYLQGPTKSQLDNVRKSLAANCSA